MVKIIKCSISRTHLACFDYNNYLLFQRLYMLVSCHIEQLQVYTHQELFIASLLMLLPRDFSTNLPGLSLLIQHFVFIPKLYCGLLSSTNFSGLYVPGALFVKKHCAIWFMEYNEFVLRTRCITNPNVICSTSKTVSSFMVNSNGLYSISSRS